MTDSWNNFIDGQTVAPSSGEYLSAYAPATGESGAQVAKSNAQDVDAAVKSAKAAQADWAARKPIERGRILMRMAHYLRENMGEIAAIEQRETGKPPWQLPLELGGCADYLEMYAGFCNQYQGEKIDIGPDYHVYTVREPFGVVGVITPWNAPLNQLCRGAAPALVTGNCVVAKPSEFTSGATLRFAQDAVEHCGLPPGVLNVVLGDGPTTGASIVSHEDVSKVAFTGSVRAGREVGKIAAERIIPLTLELGGKSPDIVFEDADLSQAVPGALRGFVANAGQVCSAGTRCFVHRSIMEPFLAGLKQAAETIKVGPEPDAMVGSITTKAQYERVLSFLDLAQSEGAKLITGGADIKRDEWGNGWFVPITVYADVSNEMRIAREEIFGPVLCVIPFDTEEEAIEMANDTEYGLAAGLWTTNLSRAHRVAGKLDAGSVLVNEYASQDVEVPFGGFKNSGYGKEKGLEAVHHYVRTKAVRIKL